MIVIGEKMKVIIIYGTECDENTAWIPWLRKKLISTGIECFVPIFPTPQNQTYQSWEKILKQYSIDTDDVVVGWSTGAIFALRYLFENKQFVRQLVLISGFNNYIGNVPNVDKINKDFFMQDERVAKNVAEEIVCIKSDNDTFITQNALNTFATKLEAKIVNISNGGHFNIKAGYDKFEELFKIIVNR